MQGRNDYVDGSTPVCSDEDILTAEAPEFFGLYLEQGPGLPDDWKPGDDYSGIGTAWETFGDFTYSRDAHGVISGGSGTGKTRILHENGDVENLADNMSFTVVVADEPTWCTIRWSERAQRRSRRPRHPVP